MAELNVGTLYSIGRWMAGLVLRSPAEKAALVALDENAKFLSYVAAYPRLKQWEAANAAAVQAMGVGVTISASTGHVATLDPPAAPSRPDTDYPGAHGKLMPPGM